VEAATESPKCLLKPKLEPSQPGFLLTSSECSNIAVCSRLLPVF